MPSQIQVKGLSSSKEKAICERLPGMLLFSLKATLKWTESKWRTVLWSPELKFEVRFGKHGHNIHIQVFRAKYVPIWWRLLLEGLVYFSKIMLNHILHLLKQHGFIIEDPGYWTGLPSVTAPSNWGHIFLKLSTYLITPQWSVCVSIQILLACAISVPELI